MSILTPTSVIGLLFECNEYYWSKIYSVKSMSHLYTEPARYSFYGVYYNYMWIPNCVYRLMIEFENYE